MSARLLPSQALAAFRLFRYWATGAFKFSESLKMSPSGYMTTCQSSLSLTEPFEGSMISTLRNLGACSDRCQCLCKLYIWSLVTEIDLPIKAQTTTVKLPHPCTFGFQASTSIVSSSMMESKVWMMTVTVGAHTSKRHSQPSHALEQLREHCTPKSIIETQRSDHYVLNRCSVVFFPLFSRSAAFVSGD